MTTNDTTVSLRAVSAALFKTIAGMAAVQATPETLADVLMEHLRAAGLRVVHADTLFDEDATVEMPTIQLPVLEVCQ